MMDRTMRAEARVRTRSPLMPLEPEIHAANRAAVRWIRRSLHRNEHLDEAEAALPA